LSVIRILIIVLAISLFFHLSGLSYAQSLPANLQQMMGSTQVPQAGTNVTGQQVQQPQQPLGAESIKEMQSLDPEAAQAFSNAMQKGDFETAKKIYDDFKNTYKDVLGPDMTGMDPKLADDINQLIKKGDFNAARILLEKFKKAKKKKTGIITRADLEEIEEPSVFERTLTGDFPNDILNKEIKQFGYDLF